MQKGSLLNALIAVKPGIAKREILEAMTYFFFSGTHVISYNDLISIQYPLNTDFKVFVKADDFFKVVSKVPGDNLKFEFDGTNLVMMAKNVKSKFATINDDQITERINLIAEDSKKSKLADLPDNFFESVSLCSYAASKNESDQTLTCIYINENEVYACDNKRIAFAKLSSKMPTILLKASEIKSLLDINPIKYCVTDSWIHFINEEGCLFSILKTKGEYPDFSEFLDFEGTKVDLPRELLEGLDIAAIFSDKDEPTVEITIRQDICRIYKHTPSGEVDYRKKINYKGSEIKFTVNPEFLKEMLNHSTEILVSSDKAKLVSGDFTLVVSLQ